MRFENTDELRGAEFVNVDLTGARFKEALLVNVRMSGLIEGLIVNDIEVAPLIPRWITLGAAGAILLAVGATYERRLQNAKQAARWISALH